MLLLLMMMMMIQFIFRLLAFNNQCNSFTSRWWYKLSNAKLTSKQFLFRLHWSSAVHVNTSSKLHMVCAVARHMSEKNVHLFIIKEKTWQTLINRQRPAYKHIVIILDRIINSLCGIRKHYSILQKNKYKGVDYNVCIVTTKPTMAKTCWSWILNRSRDVFINC